MATQNENKGTISILTNVFAVAALALHFFIHTRTIFLGKQMGLKFWGLVQGY